MAARTRTRRGFTIIEFVIVLAVIGVVAAIAVPRLGVASRGSEDRSAQASLDAAADVQSRIVLETGRTYQLPVDPEPDLWLTELNPELDWLDDVTPAAGPESVSVASDGTTAFGAASLGGDGTCWLLRRDFAPPAGTPAAVHAWADPVTLPCTGAAALALTPDPSGTTGAAWSRPYDATP